MWDESGGFRVEGSRSDPIRSRKNVDSSANCGVPATFKGLAPAGAERRPTNSAVGIAMGFFTIGLAWK